MTSFCNRAVRTLCLLAAGVCGTSLQAGEAVAPPATLNLEQAVELALSRNRNLAINGLGTRSASIAVNTAESEFSLSVRPVVSLNAVNGDSSTKIFGLAASRKLVTGTELSARVVRENFGGSGGNRERIVVQVSQPLFRFAGRLVNEEPVVQAESGLSRTRRQFEAQKQDLVVEVVREYENILRLRQQLKADRQSYQRSEALFRSTRAKEALGRASRIDTLRVSLQKGQALSRLETNRERFESAKSTFAEVLGFDPETGFELEPTVLLDIDVPPLEESVRIAFANRLDYAQVLQDQWDAERGVRIARKRLWPDLRLIARYEHTDDPPAGAFIDENRWFLGLSADTDFNQIRERNTLRQARIDAQTAQQFIELVELSIARELQQRLLAYRRASADLKIREHNLRHAKARLDLARRLYEIGRGDNFTVTDAEEAYVQAESQRLAGKSDASITGYELLRAMGALTEVPEDLKPRQL